MTGRPLPVPDEISAPFWAAAAKHVLSVARCGQCSQYTVPPDVVCPLCHSTRSWFRIHRGQRAGHHDGRGPWCAKRCCPASMPTCPSCWSMWNSSSKTDLRLIGRLLDGVHPDLHVGAAVTVAFEDIAPDVAVPAFELAR